MKKIAKMTLIVAAILIAATGCQKNDEGIDVNLKSSGVMTIVDNWKSGNAETECAAAGGDCAYAFKIDEWDEEFGMDGSYETIEENSIVILNSTGKTFDWVSEYPVCKVIVKAGRGAYVYSYPDGAYHDEGLIGFQRKGISHVTFCYSEPELVIAAKVRIWVPYECETEICNKIGYVVSSGDKYPYSCSPYQIMGISNYDKGDKYDLRGFYEVPFNQDLGDINLTDDGDQLFIKFTLNEGLFLRAIFLYAGPQAGLEPFESCPNYPEWPFVEYLDGASNTYTMTIDLDEI